MVILVTTAVFTALLILDSVSSETKDFDDGVDSWVGTIVFVLHNRVKEICDGFTNREYDK